MSSTQFVNIPDQARSGKQAPRLPVESINLSWCYTHYPTAWVFEDGHWLPSLSQLSFRAGLNGQKEDGNTTVPEAFATQKGATVLPPGMARLGKYKDYRTAIPAYSKGGTIGTFYGSMWDRWTVDGGRATNKFDIAGFQEFRAFLVERGIIEPITSATAEFVIDFKENLLNNLMGLPQTPLRMKTIADLQALVDAMRASLADIEDHYVEEAPEPAPVAVAKVRTRRFGKPAGEEA